MHRFLRAIGFSDIRQKRQMNELLNDIVNHSDMQQICKDSAGNEFAQLIRQYNDQFGISVCGEFQDDQTFYIDYFFPIFFGKEASTYEPVDIERHSAHESYAGVCDEMRVGVTLIFYIQNIADCLKHKNIHIGNRQGIATTLSALALDGKILLPISKDERQKEKIEKYNLNRNRLIAAAREGDEEAIENLTLEDIDTYSMISRRVAKEDILTIIDSYFMPYGVESDQYSVLGQILEVDITDNRMTGEKICVMKVNVNDLIFDICINKKDLLGEPLPGRRFKGNIWMQGWINYSD